MRKETLLGVCAVLLAASIPASAGPPDPSMCIVTVSGQQVACQFRFQPSGALDNMLVTVEVRDSDGVACTSCDVEVGLAGAGGVPGNFCTCCPPQNGTTDETGVVEFTFDKIGGAGLLDVNAIVHSGGDVPLDPVTVTFTSSDLDGTCESLKPVQLADEGLFGLGRNPYGMWADYNCSGTVNVVDLGVFAGEVSKGCSFSACP